MNEKLRHLDLFSGIGGFALGLESTGGFETVGFCDNEPFAQKVLKKHWPDVPCFGDVRDVGRDTDGLGAVDIITGGFPCQPFSVAGKQDVANSNSRISETFDKERILGKQNKEKSANRYSDGNVQKRGQRNFIKRMGGTIDGLSKGLDRHWGDGWEEGTPRVAEGQKNRANRLKGLGNAVVPQIPAVLGRAILEVHNG